MHSCMTGYISLAEASIRAQRSKPLTNGFLRLNQQLRGQVVVRRLMHTCISLGFSKLMSTRALMHSCIAARAAAPGVR